MFEEKKEDTDPSINIQQAILEEIQSIRSDIKDFEERVSERIEKLEERVEQVVRDLHTVHSLQRTYTGRLAVIEQMCVDQPLETSKTPSTAPSSIISTDSGRVDQ